ncbi:hypothetical protein BC829DRAFT_59103 [Chytridium lagenaria]|nr:hypothetical protein BC829DRAFT_59103 [Chytridium lagenaria]
MIQLYTKEGQTTRLEKLREENTGFNLDSGLGPRARSPRKIILKRSFSDGYVGQLTPSKRQKSSTIATANKVRASSVELSHESTSSKRQTLRSATKKNSKKTSTLKNGSNTASSPMTPPPSGSKATSFFRHMSTRSSNSDRSNDDFEDSEMLQWDVAEYKSATHSLYSSPVSSPRRGATRSQSARQNQHGPKKILTQASHMQTLFRQSHHLNYLKLMIMTPSTLRILILKTLNVFLGIRHRLEIQKVSAHKVQPLPLIKHVGRMLTTMTLLCVLISMVAIHLNSQT